MGYEVEESQQKRIEELEAEIAHFNPCKHTGLESSVCEICGYPDPRKLIAKLKADVEDASNIQCGLLTRCPRTGEAMSMLEDAEARVIRLTKEITRLRDALETIGDESQSSWVKVIVEEALKEG